jgi:16S rRNA processing protein RimM
MIKKNDCILLGTLTKPHGTKGSVILWFKDLKAEDIKERGTVFIEIDGLLVPFFIESLLEKSADAAILKLKGINSESQVKGFSGCHVFVRTDQIRQRKKSGTVILSLKGYKIRDIRLGDIGIAGDIEDIANNPLLQVLREDKEYLVPFHTDIILEIRDKEKLIVIEAPEGLFEL